MTPYIISTPEGIREQYGETVYHAIYLLRMAQDWKYKRNKYKAVKKKKNEL